MVSILLHRVPGDLGLYSSVRLSFRPEPGSRYRHFANIASHGAIIGLAGLLAVSVLAWIYRRRFPIASYGWFVFLILLAPTSSFVPIHDPDGRAPPVPAIHRAVVHHRGISAALESVPEHAHRCARSWCWWLKARSLISGICCGAARLIFGRTPCRKSPQKLRPRFQLAFADFQAGACADSVDEFQKAAALEPPTYDLLLDWALAYDCAGNSQQAIAKSQQAAAATSQRHTYIADRHGIRKDQEISGGFGCACYGAAAGPQLRHDLLLLSGTFTAIQGNQAQAVQDYQHVLALDPQNAPAREALARMGRVRCCRIGVNALYLIPGGVGGTEIYLRNLLRALAEIDSENQYIVFTNRETGRRSGARSAELSCARRSPSAPASVPARILWEQLVLPFAARKHRLNVLFNPGFTAPLLCGCPMVTVFHDLQHKRHPEYFRWFDLPFWNFFVWASARQIARGHRGLRRDA